MRSKYIDKIHVDRYILDNEHNSVHSFKTILTTKEWIKFENCNTFET